MTAGTDDRTVQATGERFRQACALLAEDAGVVVSPAMKAQMACHAALVQEWNPRTKLVSRGDAALLFETHVVDALSLVPWLLQHGGAHAHLLDIGAGGGFPALPLACVVPGLRCTLVERNLRKVGFLHRAIAAMELTGLEVVAGSYPECGGHVAADVVTARAVERPATVAPAILKRLPRHGVFLCQTDISCVPDAELFHVERVDDAWRAAGLRRGELYRVRPV